MWETHGACDESMPRILSYKPHTPSPHPPPLHLPICPTSASSAAAAASSSSPSISRSGVSQGPLSALRNASSVAISSVRLASCSMADWSVRCCISSYSLSSVACCSSARQIAFSCSSSDSPSCSASSVLLPSSPPTLAGVPVPPARSCDSVPLGRSAGFAALDAWPFLLPPPPPCSSAPAARLHAALGPGACLPVRCRVSLCAPSCGLFPRCTVSQPSLSESFESFESYWSFRWSSPLSPEFGLCVSLAFWCGDREQVALDGGVPFTLSAQESGLASAVAAGGCSLAWQLNPKFRTGLVEARWAPAGWNADTGLGTSALPGDDLRTSQANDVGL